MKHYNLIETYKTNEDIISELEGMIGEIPKDKKKESIRKYRSLHCELSSEGIADYLVDKVLYDKK